MKAFNNKFALIAALAGAWTGCRTTMNDTSEILDTDSPTIEICGEIRDNVIPGQPQFGGDGDVRIIDQAGQHLLISQETQAGEQAVAAAPTHGCIKITPRLYQGIEGGIVRVESFKKSNETSASFTDQCKLGQPVEENGLTYRPCTLNTLSPTLEICGEIRDNVIPGQPQFGGDSDVRIIDQAGQHLLISQETQAGEQAVAAAPTQGCIKITPRLYQGIEGGIVRVESFKKSNKTSPSFADQCSLGQPVVEGGLAYLPCTDF